MESSPNISFMILKIPALEELRTENFSRLLNKSYQQKVLKRPLYFTFKRAADIALSLLGIVVLSPFMILIGTIIRADSKGKALFVQERVGRNGKKFMMYKFRTMHRDSSGQEFAPKSSQDERVTRFGKFLRRTSLDELPQLFNILSGEMAVVGPRPEMPFIVQNYTDLQRARLLVKPGLTGLWQLAGRKDLPLHENVEFDLYYIEKQSLALDLIIFLKTFSVVFSGKGAY